MYNSSVCSRLFNPLSIFLKNHIDLLNNGSKFLKKVWCCIGGRVNEG